MTRPSKIVKAADARQVLPFPERRAEPIPGDLARYIAEKNAAVLRERQARERYERKLWVLGIVLSVLGAVLLTVWWAS